MSVDDATPEMGRAFANAMFEAYNRRNQGPRSRCMITELTLAGDVAWLMDDSLPLYGFCCPYFENCEDNERKERCARTVYLLCRRAVELQDQGSCRAPTGDQRRRMCGFLL